MSRKRPAETRQRISEGLKYYHASRKVAAEAAAKAAAEAADPVARRVRVMKDGFAKGSGVEDARVRNYGSIGPDAVIPSPSDVAQNLVPSTKGEGVNRVEAFRALKEGEHLKTSPPAPPPTGSQVQQAILRQQREMKRV